SPSFRLLRNKPAGRYDAATRQQVTTEPTRTPQDGLPTAPCEETAVSDRNLVERGEQRVQADSREGQSIPRPARARRHSPGTGDQACAPEPGPRSACELPEHEAEVLGRGSPPACRGRYPRESRCRVAAGGGRC